MQKTKGSFTIDASYAAEVWQNSGGTDDGSVYLDNLAIGISTDLESAFGWRGAEATVSIIYNNGNSLSELTGDAMVVSNIEAGIEALRLYDAWLSFPAGPNGNLLVGKYDVNSEFDVLDSSGLFLGSAHGIGMDIAQSGENGPSIFPVTALAARYQVELSENVTFKAAIVDGVPGDPDNPKATKISLDDEEGAFWIAELGAGGDDARLLAGTWGYTETFEQHDGLGEGTSNGIYLRGERHLSASDAGSLRGFARIGLANGTVNQFGRFLSAGLTYETANSGSLGFAIAHAGTSDSWRDANPTSGDGETVFELTYARGLGENFEIQPNIQYIVSPSADETIDDALAVGLRLTFTPSFVLNN